MEFCIIDCVTGQTLKEGSMAVTNLWSYRMLQHSVLFFYLCKLAIVQNIFSVSFDIFQFSSIFNHSNSATGYLPNSIHAVEAMLAAASIGAIWSSTSPDFGINVSSLVGHSKKAIVVILTNVVDSDKLEADGFWSLQCYCHHVAQPSTSCFLFVATAN